MYKIRSIKFQAYLRVNILSRLLNRLSGLVRPFEGLGSGLKLILQTGSDLGLHSTFSNRLKLILSKPQKSSLFPFLMTDFSIDT